MARKEEFQLPRKPFTKDVWNLYMESQDTRAKRVFANHYKQKIDIQNSLIDIEREKTRLTFSQQIIKARITNIKDAQKAMKGDGK